MVESAPRLGVAGRAAPRRGPRLAPESRGRDMSHQGTGAWLAEGGVNGLPTSLPA